MVNMPVLKRKPKRKISAARRRMYIRRRIVVCVGLLAVLAFCIFCIVSIFKGISAIGTAINKHSDVTLSKQLVPDPRPVGIIKKCNSKDVRIELSSSSQAIPMGGSVEFNAHIVYEGDDSCRIDASSGRMVLNIGQSAGGSSQAAGDSSGAKGSKSNKQNKSSKTKTKEKPQAVVPQWQSDMCVIPLKPLLMSKGDSYDKKFTWNANATIGTPSGENCANDSDLPKVSRGTYIAQIEHKDVAGLQSNPVIISVR
ncbi:peptide ABC transporter permease [Bifidobacterium sp. UMB1230]|uniref:peptide ABC transporter permease n=1 Tax=Gardnerella pickettii TaxID=2914924 RepID=UPI0031FCC028|nr:peptide ABC transporter permease [Bifidobacterium sp. UMB1230]